jgi:hypothetical protein
MHRLVGMSKILGNGRYFIWEYDDKGSKYKISGEACEDSLHIAAFGREVYGKTHV